MSAPAEFPVLGPPPGCPEVLPWAFIEPHEKQAYANHEQSLETLARRGGLDPTELVAVLEDRAWYPMGRLDAAAWVVELLARWAAGLKPLGVPLTTPGDLELASEVALGSRWRCTRDWLPQWAFGEIGVVTIAPARADYIGALDISLRNERTGISSAWVCTDLQSWRAAWELVP